MGLIYQPQAVQAGRTRPRQAADHLGRGPHRRQGDRQAGQRHHRLRRLQRGQQRRLALHRRDVRHGRRRRHLRRHQGRLRQRRPAGRSCRPCTTCAGPTTAWARPSCSSGATCRSRWPPASSACTSPRRTTSRYMVQTLRRQLPGLRHGPDPRRPAPRWSAATTTCSRSRTAPTRSRPASPGSTSRTSPWARASSTTPAPRRTDCPSACRSPTSTPGPASPPTTALKSARRHHAGRQLHGLRRQRRSPARREPPNAQEIYKVLDNAMSGVLTNRNANIDKLLSTASSQVDQVLANSR